jgi:transcriptional regulator with XRE-family HTH domain
MPIVKDPEGMQSIRKIIGTRLRAARRGAGFSQIEAAHQIGHKGVTQVSLAEDGKRIPPLIDLIKLANLYCVPLDFLVGRIDDPIAEAEEQSNGLVVRAVSNSISNCISTFTKAVSEHVGVVLSGQREDRLDLQAAVRLSDQLNIAIERLKEINPEYQDLKGGTKLESIINDLIVLSDRYKQRIKREESQRAMIETVLQLDAIESAVRQFTLDFAPLEPA